MSTTETETFETVYPTCRSVIDDKTWGRIQAACGTGLPPDDVPQLLQQVASTSGLPDFLPELARIERAFRQLSTEKSQPFPAVSSYTVNPTLKLYPASFKRLASLINTPSAARAADPEPGESVVMIWKNPESNRPNIADAVSADLLALKLVVEHIDITAAADEKITSLGLMTGALRQAADKGILLCPPSKIHRSSDYDSSNEIHHNRFLSSAVFTLQWHITQTCDLHCRHCYDRSDRAVMALEQGVSVLDDFFDFCRQRYVRGQVTFTGGNPLLYPHFTQLYQAAADRGFTVAILGNPSPKHRIEALIPVCKPSFFQVSLEGLEPYNDWIRGQGHFQRTLEFLKILRELDIYSMVMLTLTRDNMNQVLPLGEMLRNRADSFTFNRLSMVGEGASLMLPEKDPFRRFLTDYAAAAKTNPVLSIKDNLFNILRYRNGQPPFGGCTGYGCGAAFNFVSVLADGEVHACRKFPSCIGNIFHQPLEDIYDSATAHRYRQGSRACRRCALRPVCRGCLAATYSAGMDLFEEKDPWCFFSPSG